MGLLDVLHSKTDGSQGTYNARSDCCRPVPQMITSQVVSLSDSMMAKAQSRWWLRMKFAQTKLSLKKAAN